VDETWGGTTQLALAHALAEAPIAETSSRLSAIREKLVAHGGLIVNVTGSSETAGAALEAVKSLFCAFGPPRPRNPATQDLEPFALLADGGRTGAEVLSSTSLQVGFAATAIPAAPFATAEQAAELVLAHRLSTGALWEDIRMKGGAYGAFAYPDGLEPLFSLATYRDPDPARSLASFRAALASAAVEKVGDDELEKAIIGTYAKETRPRTSADKGMADFMRLLCAIEDGQRRNKLAAIVDLSAEELTAAAVRFAAGLDAASSAVIAGGAAATKAAASLGVEAKALPV
jgi:Zn-dependent M16 (insulinase) family peptidase